MIAPTPTLRLGGRRVYLDTPGAETIERFSCFGGECTVRVAGRGPAGTARGAALRAKGRLLRWHEQFSRFEPDSELSRLNRDPRRTIPVSELMVQLVEAAMQAAHASGGLVDPTLVPEIERAGYRERFAREPLALSYALALAGPRAPAAPSPEGRWREISVDPERRTVTRPPGLRLDSGGTAKGLFADILADELSPHAAFAVEAAGDVRFGGTGARRRSVEVASPFTGSRLHAFELARGAAATSGIDRRSWRDSTGRPAHHLLDPATGRAAFTGIVQATALAPTGTAAELRSKAALLSGPCGARSWLVHGGVVVYDDGGLDVIEPPASVITRSEDVKEAVTR
ncbi:MAG: FAD:protein FMN transferase [Solirubrobacterales bacterium]|nr:FAD:protein FMN transferase [Solirubrobacterales bacterium]